MEFSLHSPLRRTPTTTATLTTSGRQAGSKKRNGFRNGSTKTKKKVKALKRVLVEQHVVYVSSTD